MWFILLLKGVIETIQNEAKEQKGYRLAGKGMNRAGAGIIRAGYGSERSSIK